MLKKDFTQTKRIEKLLKGKNPRNVDFCELCLNVDPEIDDGYTTCCNECRCDGNEALVNAKQEDVTRYLGTKFNTSSHGNSDTKHFELEKKNKKFSINLNYASVEDIIREVNTQTKGLRKEF